jgi:hypothetical protein
MTLNVGLSEYSGLSLLCPYSCLSPCQKIAGETLIFAIVYAQQSHHLTTSSSFSAVFSRQKSYLIHGFSLLIQNFKAAGEPVACPGLNAHKDNQLQPRHLASSGNNEAMSGVLCVWAKIPEEVTEWYEDEYIPKMKAQHAIHTLHCELTPSGLEGQASGQLTSPWPLCSVYEVEDIEKVIKSCYDKSNHPLDNRPSDARLDSALAESRFDVHSYREIKTWRSQEWGGGEKVARYQIDHVTNS